jgi:hypothetical protein
MCHAMQPSMNVLILDVNNSVETFMLVKAGVSFLFMKINMCDCILLFVCKKMVHSHDTEFSGRIFTVVYRKLNFERSLF